MIIITGAAGFIGSCVAKHFQDIGKDEIIIVDDFNRPEKAKNLDAIQSLAKLERSELFEWLETDPPITAVIHIGARTDTTEFDYSIFEELNVEYTQKLWRFCATEQIPFIYASSAATYGDGEHGYNDDHSIVDSLEPLNPYGVSKNEFDKWALEQSVSPPHWYGLKFFNVYGPNENHKGRMASVIFHAFHQISEKGSMKLFRSHRTDYKDGEQLRDFVYVKDVVSVIDFLFHNQPESGLYNLGSGEARSFNALAHSVFNALSVPEQIEYIDTPLDIRDKYQYFTEANMNKLRKAGYSNDFYSLEDGVMDYVRNYLVPAKHY